ncbi:hypothetical protein BCR35DRAFT_1855 [Leucosporidium creatinivorum]|uniref:Uncharacterized protein n=1 Tax=Leucosporidium creatinivorum TaxID=106004 RepID=A0A1Y2G3G5_9BASI|nr:hypothetical protein BCR35DRAFT_1855 [Leucosporidium creatinivorum]
MSLNREQKSERATFHLGAPSVSPPRVPSLARDVCLLRGQGRRELDRGRDSEARSLSCLRKRRRRDTTNTTTSARRSPRATTKPPNSGCVDPSVSPLCCIASTPAERVDHRPSRMSDRRRPLNSSAARPSGKSSAHSSLSSKRKDSIAGHRIEPTSSTVYESAETRSVPARNSSRECSFRSS